MGRKKVLGGTAHTSESVELKPFCYYCDREFDTVKTLIQHQRTKHLACSECGLKFDTVTGLRVHMLNAYKKTIKEVTGAISGRENPDIVVHGMEGVPKSVIEEKTKKALAERAEKEKVRVEKERAERPTPPPGAAPSQEAPDDASSRPSSPPRPPAEETSKQSTKATKVRGELPTPPAEDQKAPTLPAVVEPPAMPPPAPARQVVLARQPPPPQPLPPQQQATTSQGMMAGLSPAVQKLLAGAPSPRDEEKAVIVLGLPGRTVPEVLSGLHPVALQVLAAAGVLPSGAGAGGAPTFAEKRPAPVNEGLVSDLSGLGLLQPAAFPPLGFPAPAAAFPSLSGSLPPGLPLTGTMGALGSHLAAGTLGFEGKRPRLEGQGLMLPVAP